MMARDQLLDRLQKRVDEKLGDASAALVNGNAVDHADYRYRTGIIQGLRLALNDIADLDKTISQSDEE